MIAPLVKMATKPLSFRRGPGRSGLHLTRGGTPTVNRVGFPSPPNYLCPSPESNWGHADFQREAVSSQKQGSSAQACQSSHPSSASDDTDAARHGTDSPDGVTSKVASTEDRGTVLRSLLAHASTLVAAGDIEGAKVLHEAIGRMLGTSADGGQVVDLAARRQKRGQ